MSARPTDVGQPLDANSSSNGNRRRDCRNVALGDPSCVESFREAQAVQDNVENAPQSREVLAVRKFRVMTVLVENGGGVLNSRQLSRDPSVEACSLRLVVRRAVVHVVQGDTVVPRLQLVLIASPG